MLHLNGSTWRFCCSPACLLAFGMVVHVLAISGLCYLIGVLWIGSIGVLLHRAGCSWADAVLIASMAGFVVVLLALLWVFSRRGVLRAWLSMVALVGMSLLAAGGLKA